MSKTCSFAVIAALLLAASPLAAQFADGRGVTVNLGGAALVHRPPVTYPDVARTNGVAGNVSLEVTLDAAGNVADAHVISGPDELRHGALTSVLQWHFARSEAGRTRQIGVAFQPAATSDQAGARPEPVIVMKSEGPAELSPAAREIQQINAQLTALVQQNRQGPSQPLLDEANALNARIKALQKIGGFRTAGISDDASRELIASLSIREGDSASQENVTKLQAAVKQFDEHLTANVSGSGDLVTVQISAPGGAAPATIRVGGNVQTANLVNKVAPVYSAAAKAAGIQGKVQMDVIIAPEGYVREIKVTSGDPMLAQAALDAVKQWTYKPTLLNGSPVEVDTTVEVNFTLN